MRPFTRGPRHPSFFFKGAYEMSCRSPGGETGACQSGLNCVNRVSTPRAVAKEPLPTTLRFPSPHPQTQSTSFLPEAEATRAWPPPRCQRTSTSRGRGAESAANGVAAAQYRGAAHTIPPPRTGGAHGPEWGAPGSPRHLKLGAPLGRPASPGAQPPPLPALWHTRPPPAPTHSTQGQLAQLWKLPVSSPSSEPPSSPSRS